VAHATVCEASKRAGSDKEEDLIIIAAGEQPWLELPQQYSRVGQSSRSLAWMGGFMESKPMVGMRSGGLRRR